MDAPTPPPISLDELDRDELLFLARQAYVLHRPRDLWRARWEVAMQRSEATGRALVEALRAVTEASEPASGRGAAAYRRHAKRYDEARAIYERARRKAARADRAEEAAYRALESCR